MTGGDGLDLLKPFLPGPGGGARGPGRQRDHDQRAGECLARRPRPAPRQIDAPALDAAALERAAIHIARPLGLDPATTPVLDARLDDGSRVAICVPPASPHVTITVRRFGKRAFSAAQLVEQGALPVTVRDAARRTLHTRRNILVSGGTGSGKTTLLNALIALIPDDERIVAIEDTLELRIDSPNCVRFEARGLQQGAVTIRDLVKHALRHRPDHIVVGEVRGGEAADLLQALNTGHGGSLTTVHANNAESALSRLASCAMQGDGDLPWEVTCRGVVDGIAMVIHMTRADGRRFVEEAAYVNGYDAGSNTWDIATNRHAEGIKAVRFARRAPSREIFLSPAPLVLVALLSCASAAPHTTGAAQVERVIDGDTISVRLADGSPRHRPADGRRYARDTTPHARGRTRRTGSVRLYHAPADRRDLSDSTSTRPATTSTPTVASSGTSSSPPARTSMPPSSATGTAPRSERSRTPVNANFSRWKPRRAARAAGSGVNPDDRPHNRPCVLPICAAACRRPRSGSLIAPWGYPPTRAPLATIRAAAHDGDLSAQFTLGWIYEHGADVPQDYREAIDWYRRAATQGEPEAINTVGLLYYYGKGVPKDPREATIWFHQAAELGHRRWRNGTWPGCTTVATARRTMTPKPNTGAGAPPSRTARRHNTASPTSTTTAAA